ncbi:MAG: TolC family protein, partial [Smithellaceae bacterium]|nr:TolC family protein [Smithellaceae bacterium]
MRHRLTQITLALFSIFFVSSANAAEIKQGDKLDLKICVEIALRRHPGIAGAAHGLKVQEAVVRQTRSAYWPQVNLSTSAGKRGTDASSIGRPSGANDEYTNTLALNQTIYDFDRTNKKVEIQDLGLMTLQAELQNTENQVAYNVKQAYWGELLAFRKNIIQAETVGLFQKHLDQALAFHLYGIRPKFDVTKAEVDLSNAMLEMVKADNALRLARALLNNSMGLPEVQAYELIDSLSFEKLQMAPEAALEKAFKNRPDLQTLLIKKAAGEKSLELAKRGHYPQISASANYSLTGDKYPLDKSWYAGGTLSLPIFSGFLVKNQIEEAAANLAVLTARIEVQRQNIRLEVIQAQLNLQEAAERIVAAERSIRKAVDNVELAQGRYVHGIGNSIEVADALLALNQARLAHLAALYDHKISWANMEKAV